MLLTGKLLQLKDRRLPMIWKILFRVTHHRKKRCWWYIDLYNLTSQKIVKADDGSFWISTTRQKTGGVSKIPLLEIPLQLIEKYRGTGSGDKVFPLKTCCRIFKNFLFVKCLDSYVPTPIPIFLKFRAFGESVFRLATVHLRRGWPRCFRFSDNRISFGASPIS